MSVTWLGEVDLESARMIAKNTDEQGFSDNTKGLIRILGRVLECIQGRQR